MVKQTDEQDVTLSFMILQDAFLVIQQSLLFSEELAPILCTHPLLPEYNGISNARMDAIHRIILWIAQKTPHDSCHVCGNPAKEKTCF